MFTKIKKAEYLGNYHFNVEFNNGITAEISLKNELWGEIFEPLKDEKYIADFALENGTLTWPNGADFAPEFLMELAKTASVTA